MAKDEYLQYDENIRSKSDEELCLMLEEQLAWEFDLPPHEEAHPCPYVGRVKFNLVDEIIRRLRKYSKGGQNEKDNVQ